MSQCKAKLSLQQGVDQFSAEAAGVFDLIVVQKVDFPNIFADAAAGNPEALQIIVVLGGALQRIGEAPRRKPMLCISCPRPLRHTKFSFGLALPRRDDPNLALALAVCAHCATDVDGIKERAIKGLGKIWPGLRPIDVTHPSGGRA